MINAGWCKIAGQLSGPLPYLFPHVSPVVQDTWDIHNPEKVTLPSYNATFCYDVKCITAVGNNEIWVGAGPSIFFLDEQTLDRRVSSKLQSKLQLLPARKHYLPVKPLNNGHVGTRHFPLYREGVLFLEVKNVIGK